MKTVWHEMDRPNAELFVGREKELQIMEDVVMNHECKILHIHGIGGLGKTALLRQFCRIYPKYFMLSSQLTETISVLLP